MRYASCYQTAIGTVTLVEEEGALTHLHFGRAPLPAAAVEEETPLLRRAVTELHEYLQGRRREFDLPLQPAGTEFQRKVWQALCAIPYGETRSYKQIAERIGHPAAFRAVGLANNRNPIAVFIPCHRVIGANGSLVGYGGGLDVKQRLLALEQA